jgi:peptidoglycan/LPS O-acetylase OafA/YrhL
MAVALLASMIVWQILALPAPAKQPQLLQWLSSHLIMLGTVSYSFYLIHQPLLLLVTRLKEHVILLSNYPFVAMVVCLLLYIPILFSSWLMFRFVERPSAWLGKSLSRRTSLYLSSGRERGWS